MRACNVVEIVTPKKVTLNGLWFGPVHASRCVVWVHGLGSSAFRRLDIVEKLVDKNTAVLTFNNRGHDIVSKFRQGKNTRIGGAGKEIFTECVDDIEGAIRFAKRQGVKDVFIAGHSTGCQKSIYWASRKGKGVRGIMLLAPISDYTGAARNKGHAATLKEASAFMKKRMKHKLLMAPDTIIDAQRYFSLYSGKSAEEIFPYWDAKRVPKDLEAASIPLLVLLAQKDEFADRPAKQIQDWFAVHMKVGDQIMIIPGATHGFSERVDVVSRAMRAWVLSRMEN